MNVNGDYPGINHQVACQLAGKAAHPRVADFGRVSNGNFIGRG
jgi:hypothetical protein